MTAGPTLCRGCCSLECPIISPYRCALLLGETCLSILTLHAYQVLSKYPCFRANFFSLYPPQQSSPISLAISPFIEGLIHHDHDAVSKSFSCSMVVVSNFESILKVELVTMDAVLQSDQQHNSTPNGMVL
jgi:hypothetical protein